jgi:hypothetical protein
VTGKNEVSEFHTFDDWMKKHNMTRDKSGVIVPRPKAEVKSELLSEIKDEGLFATDMGTASEIQNEIKSANLLSSDETTDLTKYTLSGYRRWNTYLRTGKSHLGDDIVLSTAQVERYKNSIKNISNALDKLPSYRGKVDRVMTWDVDQIREFKETLRKYQKGNIVIDKGFMSSTLNSEISQIFGKGTGGSIHMEIKSKTGKAIWEFSDKPEEVEVLFNKGTKIKIIDIKEESNNFFKVIAEEI